MYCQIQPLYSVLLLNAPLISFCTILHNKSVDAGYKMCVTIMAIFVQYPVLTQPVMMMMVTFH
jgi:hypothetical protein